MSLKPTGYRERLIDKTIEDNLQVFGAVSIEGPKWCGKTWTSKNHANSEVLLDDDNDYEIAMVDLSLTLKGEYPRLIDEWQLVPKVWDKVRREVDKTGEKGKFILTGSTKLSKRTQEKEITHSGTGRIVRLYMHPMSLYESGISDGKASLTSMYNGTQENANSKKHSVEELITLILRGGWPANIDTPEDKCTLIPQGYLKSVLEDIDDRENGRTRDKRKMNMLLRALARNETTMAGDKKLLNDIADFETEQERLSSINTLQDYLDILERLHITENQNSYSINYVSRERVGKNPKRHFTDPSLACAALKLSKEKLLKDMFTLGFMYEAFVERDLRVNMGFLDGELFHFRDNVTKLEVDSILEFPDGEYAAIEIKLGSHQIEEAKANLMRYYNLTTRKPKFMAVICGTVNAVIRDPETGIYILPITALKP